MKLSDPIVMLPHVLARQVGDETVLLELETGTYFGLDPIGASVWRSIETGKTLQDICDALITEYEVARETLERDILALMQQLQGKKLIATA